MLQVNEIFHSIQCEGPFSGRSATFVRLQGCNLRCSWCDTPGALQKLDCVPMEIGDICNVIQDLAPMGDLVVITGGEPFMQDISNLIGLIHHKLQREVQVETNGTIFPGNVENGYGTFLRHCTVVISPKPGQPVDRRWLKFKQFGAEVFFKYVVADRATFADCFIDAEVFQNPVYLQPVSCDPESTKLCIELVKGNPKWRLSAQLHKLLGIQ